MCYGTWPSFRGGSSFRGIRVFQLKLYFHTKFHVDWRLPSTLCKKNNKDCFYEGCSIFFIDLNLNMGLMLYSKWVDVFKMFSVSHLSEIFSKLLISIHKV